MRTILLAVLVVLACTFSVSASSADWAAPSSLDAAFEADLSASELQGRLIEFAEVLAATGPVQPSSSSSSTGAAPSSSSSSTAPHGKPKYDEPVKITFSQDCTQSEGPRKCTKTADDVKKSINATFGFPSKQGESLEVEFHAKFVEVADSTSSSSTGAVATNGRRLLASVEQTDTILTFVGSAVDGGAAEQKIYTVVSKSLACQGTVDEKKACIDGIAADYGVPSLAADPAFVAIAAAVVPGTLVSDSAITTATPGSGNNVESSGGPRRTNGGFYFLGAVVLLFIVIALVYFIVHKKPDNVIASPVRGDAEMAPVVAAPAGSGVVGGEDAALAGGAGQMDYRSVFALKHNVLDKNAEQKDDEHNHQDVHFILHQ